MIELPESFYFKLIEPLSKVEINQLFARSVIEKKIAGKVYVDNIDTPSSYYVLHPYGMSLLFGDWRNTAFNKQLLDYSLNKSKERQKTEWMQTWPRDWDSVLEELYAGHLVKSSADTDLEKGKIILNTRVNFRLNRQKFSEIHIGNLPQDCSLVEVDQRVFSDMIGSVVPMHFWNSADDFVKLGKGFSILYENQLAATAFSAFIFDNKLEIGIETISSFQQRGLGKFACKALIDYCLEKELEPVWSCRIENTASYHLAQKLGYEISYTLPYYQLCV